MIVFVVDSRNNIGHPTRKCDMIIKTWQSQSFKRRTQVGSTHISTNIQEI